MFKKNQTETLSINMKLTFTSSHRISHDLSFITHILSSMRFPSLFTFIFIYTEDMLSSFN